VNLDNNWFVVYWGEWNNAKIYNFSFQQIYPEVSDIYK